MGDAAGRLLTAATSLALLAVIFAPLERVFRGRRRFARRPALGLDLAFFFWQHVLWTGAVATGLAAAAARLEPTLAPLRAPLSAVPLWGQAVIAWVLGDLLLYGGHRLQHRVDWLWRFHRLHHTAEEVDWLAAFREHPLDGLYTRALVNLPAILMGFSLSTIAGLIAFRGLWAVFIHANVKLPVGPLKYLMGAPSLHRWHHDRERGGRVNFANLMPFWDVVFGTYYEPAEQPEAFGAEGPTPRRYWAALLEPLGLRLDRESKPQRAPEGAEPESEMG
ncbi:MAG: sterol desaturase family protein [Myxococcales bacterium]|nr:sterol desaturase family protein [Myxococcales bacterium]